MAKSSTLTLTVAITGDGGSLTYTPPGAPLTNAAAPVGGPFPQALASGDNTINVPSGAQSVMIIPPTTSTVAKKLKGVGGDTGFSIAQALTTVVSLPASTATILINAASSETVTLLWL